MLGRRLTSYEGNAAPSGFPSASRNGNGDVTFTFASSYQDPYGIAGSFIVAHPRAMFVSSAGDIGMAPCEIVNDTTLRVRAFFYTGGAYPDAKVTLVVHSGG
jgi:hypothetical protein